MPNYDKYSVSQQQQLNGNFNIIVNSKNWNNARYIKLMLCLWLVARSTVKSRKLLERIGMCNVIK